MSTLAALLINPLTLASLFTLGYAATCAIWPFKRCRRCKGAGRHRAPLIRAFRPCRLCSGSGYRLRVGRRVHNAWTRVRRDRRR
ncbi:hypothetical protein CLV40_11296 [Actinokineospora auranticolor]|uniref:Uncharacterized protein n=1 Tax=Actinokineospora auranticolor TaxID=155976 RepID=A0A2S6GKR5_9PSEU|nr:hypothetical protein CLV40_11296 [Actinokineospora auranticolor]